MNAKNATVPLFNILIRSKGDRHRTTDFVARCTRNHWRVALKNAKFLVTDDEDVARRTLLKRQGIPVILITPDEFKNGSAVPVMKEAHPEFCPIHPGDVALHLHGVIESMIKTHFPEASTPD